MLEYGLVLGAIFLIVFAMLQLLGRNTNTSLCSGAKAFYHTCGTFTNFTAQSGATVHPRSLYVSGNAIFYSEEAATPPKIGEMTLTGGSVAEWTLPAPNGAVTSMTIGPDKNLWYTEWCSGCAKIGRITLSAGTVAEYTFGAPVQPESIRAGPDGNLWFTLATDDAIDKISTAGASLSAPTRYQIHTPAVPDTITDPVATSLMLGRDGSWYFVEAAKNKIGRMSMTGTMTGEWNTPNGPFSLTQTNDGNFWFTEAGADKVAVMDGTTHGVTEYSVPGAGGWLWSLVQGGDNDVYVVDPNERKVLQYTLSGTRTDFTDSADDFCLNISVADDHNIWCTGYSGGALVRLS